MKEDVVVFCPYCGERQSEEHDLLMNLLQEEVFSLECSKCGKSCVLILYDDVRSSNNSRKVEE